MTVTVFGTYNAKVHPRIQVVIDGLRTRGVTVHELNVPLPVDTAERVAILKQPWRLPGFLLTLLRCWLQLALKVRRAPEPDVVIIAYMCHFDIHLARLLYRRKTKVADYLISGSDTGRDRQISNGLKDKLLVWLDNACLRAADIVMVDTEEHRLRLPERYRRKGLVVHVGAPDYWFETGRRPVEKSKLGQPLKIIFFGLYTALQGAPIIGAALQSLIGPVEVRMIGHGQEYDATKLAVGTPRASTRVEWIEWIDAKKLPALAAQHDICLGIFGTGPKAQRVVPNKVYQGAAVGCAIITSNTVSQRHALGDAAVFVPAGDAHALARAIDELAGDPARLLQLRQAAYNRARQHFRPEQVVEPLLLALRQVT